MNRPRIIKCKVEGCSLKHYSNGYCQYHYWQAKEKGYIKNQKPKPTAEKKCKGCTYFQPMIGSAKGCAYANITGDLRGCPPEKCTRFKPQKTKLKERDKSK